MGLSLAKRLAGGASVRAYRAARRMMPQRFPPAAFHEDRIYQRVMLELAGSCGASSFVETGTFKGAATRFIAERCPDLPIYSIEIDLAYHREAAAQVAAYPSVQLVHGASPASLAALLSGGGLAGRPLFYLDAHWYYEWPLPTEVDLIARQAGPCIVVIDDFQVPGLPDFTFDVYFGQPCNLDLIRPRLGAPGRHRFVFPNYSCRDAFGMPHLERLLAGWVAIFQDLDDLCEEFVRRPSVAGVVKMWP